MVFVVQYTLLQRVQVKHRCTAMAFSFNFDISSQIKQDCNNDTLSEKEQNGNQDIAKNQSPIEVTSQLAALGKACRVLYS